MSGRAPLPERLYAMLLRLYPANFRAEYGSEMLQTFKDWHRCKRRGALGGARFWGAALIDYARSLPREWSAELQSGVRSQSPGDPDRPPYAAAALAGLAVFVLYVRTLAPTTAFWDASEYITVAHILGIPHPPGSPLFVLLARAWEILLAPLGLSVAVRINLLSAALSAIAHAFWFLVADRALAGWAGDRLLRRVGAAAAVVLSATAFTVWNQSVVNEKVYSIAFLTTALVSWLILRWRDTGRSPKGLLLVAFILGLTATNHLMGVLVVPALLAFVLLVDQRALFRARLWGGGFLVVAMALSVHFFLPLRAAQRPIIAEGEPVCESAAGAALSVYTWGRSGCEALSSVLTREQYGKPSIMADPNDPRRPRGGELLRAQFANYAQYFNWQWARSIGGQDPLFGGARVPLTLAFVALGVLGFRAHRRGDPAGAAYLALLFLTLSAGLVVYLNFRFGYSIARDRYPASGMHEVRERDYFFLVGFSVWGLWAGMGVASLWRRISEALVNGIPWPRLAAAPVLGLALVPLALNWGWASRAEDYAARDWAYNVLMSVEPYGVLFTNGDNDTFPLWYLQEVEGIRKDVTVVVASYFSLPWYAKQIRDLTEPCAPGDDPADNPTRIICQRPFDPAELPPALAQAGWLGAAKPPRDSILPLSNEEIDQIAGDYFIAQEPMIFRAGQIAGRVEPGTPLSPADIFAASALRATLGARPIHAMPGSQFVSNLGLWEHTVRQGITWKIHNGPLPAEPEAGIVPLPRGQSSWMAGAAIDLPLTDTLVWDVYLRRGRILDPDKPWVDAATTNILSQYAYTHYTAAQAHALREAAEATERHLLRAGWWEAVAEN